MDVGEVHVILGELLENVIVMDCLGSNVLVISQLRRSKDYEGRMSVFLARRDGGDVLNTAKW